MKTAIIGGGASGMTSAIFAARNKNSVTVFERSDRTMKKLLATGNGRCNLSNKDLSAAHFHSSDRKALEKLLSGFTKDMEEAFFESIGIMLVDENGRLYPRSRRASSVVDALRFEAESLNVKIVYNTAVKEIKPLEKGFVVNGMYFDNVIVSSGGSAAPVFGTDGNSFSLLKKFGHSIAPCYPSLVPLKTTENVRRLKGVRVHCRIYADELFEDGEVQFTDYGVSGIAVMQLSRVFCNKSGKIIFDLFPEMESKEVYDMLVRRCDVLAGRRAEDFLSGAIHKSLAIYILDRFGISPKENCGKLKNAKLLGALSNSLKKLEFTVSGTCGFQNAQTTLGGAYLSEFNPLTLESVHQRGLYCTGEALDCAGDCGGYNLHWAWLTGYIAGNACAGLKNGDYYA